MKSKMMKLQNPTQDILDAPEKPKTALTPLAVAVRTSIVGLGLAHGAVQAATITVDSNADGEAPVDCTLRAAIASAQGVSNECELGGAGGADTIVFDDSLSSNTISLMGGELSISSTYDLTINAYNTNGPIVVDAIQDSRVFNIDNATVTINSMTITGGSATGASDNEGGGLYVGNNSEVTLNDSTVSSNTAVAGGGILADTSTLILNNTKIVDNVANSYGGGIQGYSSTISLDDSTVDNNQAADGGGIEVYNSPTLDLTNTTVSNNTASSSGGGLRVYSSETTLQNTTISGNQGAKGGGLYTYSASAYLSNVTVSNNSATTMGGIGGLYAKESEIFYVSNSIIANSIGGDCDYEMYGTPVTLNGFTIIEDGSCDADNSGDPGLLPLADNGGTTLTHALRETSIARDKGSLFGVPAFGCTIEDQRGQMRDDGDMLCDMGAIEYNSEDPGSIDDDVFYVIPLPDGKVVVIPL